ncbi:RNI-like protein [Patellaria atrata CBS 101060]|uniref:RNI-like protein n=1 Tax=Patellaria atrata CBS 101060 TaxID=1346257 RepID=A0A9P4S2R9_9PEZI|nr:RNI-like protein [Patellaria atrata CBS 101060]
MEEVHGIDVSWLHHSNKDHHHRSHAPSSPGLTRDVPPSTSSHGGIPNYFTSNDHLKDAVRVSTITSNGEGKITQPPKLRRPGLMSRTSSDKINASSPENKRRTSWMSSISSKFSSQAQVVSPPNANAPSSKNPTSDLSNGPNNTHDTGHENGAMKDNIDPPSSLGRANGFFSNALRRLSSGTSVPGAGKAVVNGGICPRRVLNIDHDRTRCLLPELDQNKLRKVAFCVDVEIAGGPKYKDDPDPLDRKKKSKDKKIKEKEEREALKNPDAIVEDEERNNVVQTGGEDTSSESVPTVDEMVVDDKKEISRKKEKKKRSEEERKERKEKKRRKAEENGTIPVELTRDEANASTCCPTRLSSNFSQRTQDRPTTDPVRIYRRCCQLRETPILKRISDQLTAPTTCAVTEPGIVTHLDLTGSRMTLADIVTFSDWLAVVPVKKLTFEDSDLTDEGVRVILAGLLAAKAHSITPHTSNATTSDSHREEKLGVIEKLSLKNNPRITSHGWRHISLFLYMCRSIKAIDVSMIPFQVPKTTSDSEGKGVELAEIFSKAVAERLAGNRLEELIMGECALTAQDIRKIIDGVTVSGLQRLGLAGNNLGVDGLQHVINYVRSGVCKGLDLGSNDLRNGLSLLAEGLHASCPLWALSLANCNLSPDSLKPLMPALARLPDLRFIDLSHNKELFDVQPSACGLLRKFIPQLKMLKRLHLADVSMSPAQAIAIAEVLPETPHLAHLSIIENPQLSALANVSDEATQEEACALYASLMAAVRVSESIICIDVDVPSQESSEIVKALAKQVVAYCLRNLERVTTGSDVMDESFTAAARDELQAAERNVGVQVPVALLHLVGHVEGFSESLDDDEPAPGNDYIVGGTGVVKALSYCLLEKAKDKRRNYSTSGTSTPKSPISSDETEAKAKNMSKNLLGSARKIRQRLQPALVREAKGGDDMAYRRLIFLDQTLRGMIQRFEDEYPECRLPPEERAQDNTEPDHSVSSSPPTSISELRISASPPTSAPITAPESDEDDEFRAHPRSRQASEVSLASRLQTREEGKIHRIGQTIRRDLLRSTPTGDDESLFFEDPPEPAEDEARIESLRRKFEALSAEELKGMTSGDFEHAMRELGANAKELESVTRLGGEDLEKFRQAHRAAYLNGQGREEEGDS